MRLPFDLTSDTSGISLLNENVEGMGMPRTKTFTQETALLDGQSTTGWKAEPREVFWPIMIHSDPTYGWDANQSNFWATMRPNSPGLWRVTKDGSYRELQCRFADDGGGAYATDPSREGAEVHGITLIADDPWWKGPTVSKTFQTAEDPLPFFAVTTDRVFNLMSSSTVDNVTLANPGDVAAWPVFRLDGPVTGFRISGFPVGAGVVSTTINLTLGEWLIIDTNPTAQTAIKYPSMQNVTSELQDASWSSVPAGSTSSFYVTVSGTGSLTVSFRPNYFRAF